MSTADRLYIDASMLHLLAQGEYARLFEADNEIAVEVTYGFSSANRAQYSAFGNWQHLVARLSPVTEQPIAYLMFSYSGRAAISVSYHSRFSSENLRLIVRNACWVATQAENLGREMRDKFEQ